MAAVTAVLDVQGLSVWHDDHHVVRGVDLRIGAGETFGIVGESGCGKSTILRALAGLARRWSGRIGVNGRSLNQRRTRADRGVMQMVFQDPLAALNPVQTIDDTLREPLIIHRLSGTEARIANVLDAVGLPRNARFRYPAELSGGQRQRVCIARALLVQPSLLLLDEPMASLDMSVQAEILNLLTQLQSDTGLAMLLVSHDIGVVSHICTRVAVMAAGRFDEVLDRSDLAAGRVRGAAARTLLGLRPAVPRSCGRLIRCQFLP